MLGAHERDDKVTHELEWVKAAKELDAYFAQDRTKVKNAQRTQKLSLPVILRNLPAGIGISN